jgi:tetratricopeptide (TPR) repeat protein
MLRLRIVLWGITLLTCAGWLFSQEIEPPDLLGVIKNIEATLRQLQKDVKDLHGSVKELSKSGRKKPGQPAASPSAVPDSGPAWQLAREAYERGRRSEELKACGPATEEFTKAIQLDPKNDSAFLHRAYCHYELGEYADAIADLDKSLALQPNNSRAYAKRASALAASGKASAAILDANEAIHRDAKNPAHYLLRASLNQQLGNSPGTMDDFAKAIALAPDSDSAYLARAAFLRSQGQVQKALDDCYQAIRVNSADAAAYVCRAQFYLSTGAAQPALEDINRAMLIGHNPGETTALLASAQNMLRSGQSVSSPAQLPAANSAPALSADTADVAPLLIALPATTTAVTATAPAPAVEKRKTEATDSAARRSQPAVVRNEPAICRDANCSYRNGRLYSDQQRFDEALSAYSEALRLEPKNALFRNARGYAYLRQHQYREAIADFNEALRLNPNYVNASRNRAVAMESVGMAASSR